MTRLEKDSPCKINLLLNVLGRRPDGFHELETLMYPVALCDTLRFERVSGGRIDLTCSDERLPVDSTNLVVKAAERFFDRTGLREGVRIHLQKRIPLAAGLGGGSGNAATTLLALNQMFAQPLNPKDLERLAAELGSDVPFFLQPYPALATGRGEHVTPLGQLPALQNVSVLLVHPGFGVSTPWAYQTLADFPKALNGLKGRAQALADALRTADLETGAALFFNSLEAPVLRKYPVLKLYQQFLRDHGAIATLMSGSGSTTFALFNEDDRAQKTACAMTERFGAELWTAVVPLREPTA